MSTAYSNRSRDSFILLLALFANILLIAGACDAAPGLGNNGNGSPNASLPVINQQPASTVALYSGNVSFKVVVPGSPQFQWKKNGLDLIDYGNVFGARSANLKLVGVWQENSADGAVYRVKVNIRMEVQSRFNASS